MPLAIGQRLGPYEIAARLGAGGMGEVYKARDTRLGRFVAVKVLPEELSRSADALARFEREARAIAVLNHPSLVGIHDVGSQDGTTYVVMELLEGESLRARLAQGPLPPRKAVELATEMAEGLAAAHEKGIVHRDLKPDNLWLTREGRLKILDFGLAKEIAAPAAGSVAPTATGPLTGYGTILGTVGYMSPEQVRGEAVDARTDLFSFGVVLYEMLTARRAFERPTASDTMAAILRDEPPELAESGRPIPPSLARIVHHCLEKRPEQRFQTARDLAFALRDSSSPASSPASTPSSASAAAAGRGAPWRSIGAAAATLILGAGLAGWALRRAPSRFPTFRPLTHERGTLGAARFVAGSGEVVYGARWSGGAAQWYSVRLDQPGTRTLEGLGDVLLSVSASGEGVGLTRPYLSHGVLVGSLFSVPLTGGAKREWVSTGVWGAAPGPQPGELAASIGSFGGEMRLEWPLGHVLLKGFDVLRDLRIRGDLLALFHEQGDRTEDGSIDVVDRAGKRRVLTAVRGFTGLAWGPGEKEIWFSTYRNGESEIAAVDLSARVRTLLRQAGRLELQDVDATGRVLAALHSYQRQTFGRAAGESSDRDLGWLDAQAALGLTADGGKVLLAPLAEWARIDGTLYLRPLSGEPPQTLGLGQRQSTITGDGKWVLTCRAEPAFSLVVMPTGPGPTRTYPLADFAANDMRVDLLPDEKNALIWGRRRGEPFAFHSLDLATGAIKTVTTPGTSPFAFQGVLSPDGRWIAFVNPGRPHPSGALAIDICHPDGSESRAALEVGPGDAISGWGADSASLYLWDRSRVPAEVDRVDIATGRRTRALTIQPADPVGVPGIQVLLLTPDARAYVYNVTRKLSQLYVVEGLR